MHLALHHEGIFARALDRELADGGVARDGGRRAHASKRRLDGGGRHGVLVVAHEEAKLGQLVAHLHPIALEAVHHVGRQGLAGLL